MKKFIIGSAIVLVIGGAIYYYYRQANLLTNLTYKLIGFHFESLSLTNSVIDLELRIWSQSTIEATIKNLDLQVFIDGVKLGNINELTPIVVPAKGYSDIGLKVSFSPLTIGQNALNLLSNYQTNKDSKILMTGFATVKSSFIETTVPFTYETTIREILAS